MHSPSAAHSAELSGADSVVAFWREAGPSEWFGKRPAFDAAFRQRFQGAHEAAKRGDLAHWRQTPTGVLALLILLDQYPRNAFRGTARMYATDALAREVATHAVAAGLDRQVETELRFFCYLPFAHSEALEDQERSVLLHRRFATGHLVHAQGHRDIIRRFGRFPHRNAILGRRCTAEEQAFLDRGGFAG